MPLYEQEANYVLTPGEPLPTDVYTSMESLASSATTVTVTDAPTSSSTSDASAAEATSDDSSGSSDDSSGLSTGAIVGIAIGGVALLALAGGLFWYVCALSHIAVVLYANIPAVSLPDILWAHSPTLCGRMARLECKTFTISIKAPTRNAITCANTIIDFFGRSKTLSEQLRHSRTPAAASHMPPQDPYPGYGGPDSRHTSGLPPYAPAIPTYQSEAKPPGPLEADGGPLPHGYGQSPMSSPEMRQSETFGGFVAYPDSMGQNRQMR